MQDYPSTVIVGAGIVGLCTAFYLSTHQKGSSIHLVETTDQLFASASGYAGGFLAQDWFAPELAELAALSYYQHRVLAAHFNGPVRWGYRPSKPLSYTLPGDAEAGDQHGEDWLRQGASRSTAARTSTSGTVAEDDAPLPEWLSFCLSGGDNGLRSLAEDGPTAQVDPLGFCQTLLFVCKRRGVQLYQPARAVAIGKDAQGVLSHVRLEVGAATSPSLTTLQLPCRRLLLTAGAWTPRVLDRLFPSDQEERLPISSLAGYSLLLRHRLYREEAVARDTPRHALFAAGHGLGFCPEVFSRADGTLYLAGLNTKDLALPAQATDAVPAADQLATLLEGCRQVLCWEADDEFEDGDSHVRIVRAGLCHRPVTPWGRPLVTRLPDSYLPGVRTLPGEEGGVFVAAGHGPWGISLGPGTGMVLAELAQGREPSADVSGLGFP